MVEPYNEKKAWTDLETTQKSYVVRVLNWFHFRPKQLAHSWTREEVLTWELYRAMEILPRRFFLAPLLECVGAKNSTLAPLTKHLSGSLGSITIDAYPLLQLTGSLRNRRSDIGVAHPDGTRIWIEAKTVTMSAAGLQDLHQQMMDQQDALNRITGNEQSKVVALVPTGTVLDNVPAIAWTDVLKVLEMALTQLGDANNRDRDFDGYRIIAKELHDRIQTHPNKIA